MRLLILSGLPAALCVPLLLSSPAAGQEPCPGGAISFIFVDNHSIFDPDDLSEEQRLLWAYRLANTLHMRTAEGFLRRELLFSEGDCYDPRLLDESERLLRLYPFIATADLFGVEQPDGTWHVLVDTKDEWTTKVGLRVDVDDGPRLRGWSVTEENLVGRGIRTSVFFHERDEQRDLGGEFFTPRIFGTRLDLGLLGGRTRIGRFVEQELFYPFVGEVGRLAARQVYLRREEFFPYSVGARRPEAHDVTHVLLPMSEERIEVTLAARLGTPGNLTTFGLGFSRASLDFPAFPDAVEIARAEDFGEREPAPPETAERVAEHTLHSPAGRLNVLVGQRNVRFTRRRGLDALAGVQDVPVGSDLGLTLGRSVGLGSTGADRADDLYARFRVFVGADRGSTVMNTVVALEGRQLFGGSAPDGGWKDVLGEVDLLLYWQPQALEAHTLLLRAEGVGGWELQQPFQLTLGGGTGVRGYRHGDYPASQRLVVTLEDRVRVPSPWPDLVDVGFTVFTDVGRGWAGDVPFGIDSGWRGAVGGGLRFGFPAGSRGVVRLDVAFPLGPGTGPGDVVVSASLGDLLGLAGGFENPQLARSRRTTVGPDLFTTER